MVGAGKGEEGQEAPVVMVMIMSSCLSIVSEYLFCVHSEKTDWK